METFFENISVHTQQQICEMIWHYSRKRIVFNLVIMAVCAVLIAVMGLLKESVIYCAAAVAYIGLFVWQLIKPRRMARKEYKRRLAYYDNVMPPATYLFYSDHFAVTDIDSNATVPYDKIKAVIVLKSGLSLEITDGRVYWISHQGFRKGTAESLRSFLCDKSPMMNPAQWKW